MDILSIRPLGDTALTLELAPGPGAAASALVARACEALDHARTSGQLPGLEEVAGAFRSVTLYYDPLLTGQEALLGLVRPLLKDTDEGEGGAGRAWSLPCLFDEEVAPDLAELPATLGISREALIDGMTAAPLSVHALGFLPGLPFMGDLAPELGLPRRTEPRARVPAGSVAIANRQCVIYPWESPGGWHILGRCPVPLFDIARPRPALLASGDLVHLRPVDRAAFDALSERARAGELDPDEFRTDGQPHA